ncbi:MAG: T9SS type A sorting domain-containing protein [Bacteroidota bacterium]
MASISDPVGGNPFGGFSSQSVVLPLTGLNRLSEVYNPFTQPFMASPGVVELEIDLMAEDAITSNNLFQRQYRIDSILAYDDGQAEQSFGINKPWGVANAFYSPTEDSIRAVWISFVPTINFNSITTQLTYMEEASFRLTIWDDPNPDSILVQQIGGSKVQYGDQVNHFHRYLLSDPVAVKDSFWVGIVQVSTEPIGVGWDKNYPGKDLIWFDNSGSWEPLDIEGSLMIRPEFQISASMPASIESSPELAGVSIFPNPFEGVGELRLRRTTGSSTGPYQGRLYDMQGRIVTEVKLDRLQNIASIPLPSDLQPGIYLWQHQIGKEAYLYTEKLIIR